MPVMRTIITGIAAAILACSTIATALAQKPADFYKGKNVDLMIGYSVGGGYDVYARLIARHMGKHIPGNPTVTPKNMEGAGSQTGFTTLRLRMGRYSARSAAAPVSIRCSGTSRRSSTALSSTGLAARTMR